MFETVAETLVVFQEDKTIQDVLCTVGSAIISLADKPFTMDVAFAVAEVLRGAEKRIKEITQTAQ